MTATKRGLTASEWWEFAPWQGIATAPLLTKILVNNCDGFFNIAILHDEEQRGWYKKWLPLPELLARDED